MSVNGGNEKATLGTLTLMVGGPDDAVAYCWPLFSAFGQHIFHMGPVGSGVVGKLVNNLIALGSYALQLEAMRLAAAYGLEEDAVTTAVIASMGDNRGIRTWGRHDRKRAIRAAQGTDWSERMGRDLEEAAIAAGAPRGDAADHGDDRRGDADDAAPARQVSSRRGRRQPRSRCASSATKSSPRRSASAASTPSAHRKARRSPAPPAADGG